MSVLPANVSTALEALKKKYSHPYYVVVRRINGRYYAYRDLRPWDSAGKKRRTVSEYLGRIREDGTFIKKEASENDEIENARSLIVSHGGRVYLPEKGEAVPVQVRRTSPDETDTKILTALSMDARATLQSISEQTGISASAVNVRIRQLEKRYGIRYLAEIDVDKLGFTKFIILVKFLEMQPHLDVVKAVLSTEPRIQFAASLSGSEFQLIIYAVVRTGREISHLARDLPRDPRLSEYPAEWYTTPFYETYGFAPLREEFIDTLKRERQKKGLLDEEKAPKSQSILDREFAVLKELNEDGKATFTEIDKKYGFDEGRAQYSYHKLLQNGVLRRVTLTMQNLPIRYAATLLLKVTNPKEFADTTVPRLQNIIEESGDPTNRYALVGDIGIPFGILYIVPIFGTMELEETMRRLYAVNKGIAIQAAVITDVLIGKLCYRRFDNAFSVQNKVLTELKAAKTIP